MMKTSKGTGFIKFGVLVLTSLLALLALTLPIAIRPDYYRLAIGEVAQEDIMAPSNLVYQSDVLTEQAQEEAANAIPVVYTPPDPRISRQQLELLRTTLDFIDIVRQDPYTTPESAQSDLSALNDVTLTPEMITSIISENESTWQEIKLESMRILEEALRSPINEQDLSSNQALVQNMVSVSFSESETSIITSLVTPFIVPNSFPDASITSSLRAEARENTAPVFNTIISGESLLRRGQIVTPIIWEVLQQYGLIQTGVFSQEFWATLSLIFVCFLFTLLYFTYRRLQILQDLRNLTVTAILFLVFLFATRFLIPNRAIIPYLFPIPAFGLTIAVLFSLEAGMVFTVILSMLATFGLTNGVELIVFYSLTTFCGILILGRGRRVSSFFLSGFVITVSGIAIILAYRLSDSITDLIGLTTLSLAALFCGFASTSLTLILQFLLSQLLELTTSLQLLDLSRPDHPLLQFLLRNAPGTYQHSLQVANLAEQAAEAVGADALLTRVGALYHDAGKAANPSYYIENQVPGSENPHEGLDPATSASIIIHHVADSIQLAKKYHIPPRLRDFMVEHHGTLLARYQYSRAIEAAGNKADMIDEELFRYPGPKPGSKETALLMLADGCEARARADLPKDEEDLRKTIQKVFDFCIGEGQLTETNLTFKDLGKASESFFNTLRNVYHPRIVYPELPGNKNPDKKQKTISK